MKALIYLVIAFLVCDTYVYVHGEEDFIWSNSHLIVKTFKRGWHQAERRQNRENEEKRQTEDDDGDSRSSDDSGS